MGIQDFPLKESRLAATWLAAVCLSSIAAPADDKDHTAGRTPTDPLTNLVWQRARVFLKAGLDNARRSWQAKRWARFQSRLRPFWAPSGSLRLGPFFFRLWKNRICWLEKNTAEKQLKEKVSYGTASRNARWPVKSVPNFLSSLADMVS
jgi:hypothetical protein